MTLAMIVFFASFALIVALFTLRFLEERRGGKYAPRARELADNAALNLKDALEHGRTQIERLPPEVAHHSMRTVHKGALGAAGVARTLEEQAHRFADFVASKRNFQRRETKSAFLKQVTEFKNGAGDAEERSEE